MRKIDLLEDGTPCSAGIFDRTARIAAETDDPQIIFKPPNPLEAGWYRFETQIKSSGEVDPQVFFDFGAGFSEIFSIRLKRRRTSNVYALTVKLPFRALFVRLDPMNVPGEFALSQFSAERLSGSRLGRDLAAYGLAVLWANPRGFFSRLPAYLKALNRPNFLRLADPKVQARTNLPASYRGWIARHDFNEKRHGEVVREAVARLASQPLISVLMPVYNTPEQLLREAINSVLNQIYGNWQLCIADDFSTKPHVRRLLETYAARDSRIKVVFRQANGHISHATNSAFELADGEWAALLDHDDLLRPHALAEVAMEIGRHPDAELIYSDEDKLDKNGKRYEPYFKPDFSRELFRSQNYLNHLTVHRAANIRAVGGWRPGFEGSQDYDLNLRIVGAHRREENPPHTENSLSLARRRRLYGVVERCKGLCLHGRPACFRGTCGSNEGSGQSRGSARDALLPHAFFLAETGAVGEPHHPDARQSRAPARLRRVDSGEDDLRAL